MLQLENITHIYTANENFTLFILLKIRYSTPYRSQLYDLPLKKKYIILSKNKLKDLINKKSCLFPFLRLLVYVIKLNYIFRFFSEDKIKIYIINKLVMSELLI